MRLEANETIKKMPLEVNPAELLMALSQSARMKPYSEPFEMSMASEGPR